MKFTIDKANNFFKIEGSVPNKLRGANISIMVFHNNRKIKDWRTKPYSEETGPTKHISNTWRVYGNADILGVYINNSLGIPVGTYSAIAFALNTDYRENASESVQ